MASLKTRGKYMLGTTTYDLIFQTGIFGQILINWCHTLLQYMYHASFIILYYDQQMHN